MYEVRDGEAFELHHDSVSGQRKTKVNLERLEVVRNDLIFGLPFESCIEEKTARVNKYAVSDGRNSRFEEVHQVGTGGGGGGGTAGNSWRRCADLISISNQKKSSSTLVFRPGLYELKSLLLTLERQQNDFLNAFLIPVSLSLSYLTYSIGIETTNTLIHSLDTPVVHSKIIPHSRPKQAQSISVFRP